MHAPSQQVTHFTTLNRPTSNASKQYQPPLSLLKILYFARFALMLDKLGYT